jgi:LEA14-like dessication related protein
MNLKHFFSSLAFVFITLFFTSCIEYKDVEVVKVSDVGIKSISLGGIDVGVSMQIKNPNNYDISIVDSDLTLFTDGKRVGNANVKEKIKIPKKSNKIHRFTVQTSTADIVSNAIPLLMSLMSKTTLEVQITGDIKAKAKGLSKRFPVDFKDKVKLD